MGDQSLIKSNACLRRDVHLTQIYYASNAPTLPFCTLKAPHGGETLVTSARFNSHRNVPARRSQAQGVYRLCIPLIDPAIIQMCSSVYRLISEVADPYLG